MDGDAAPETEVPQAEDEGAPAGKADDDAAENPQPKGGAGSKKKRTWQKVNTADYYQPAPYVAQKGGGKGGGKGAGKGGKSGADGDGAGHKGKGKGGGAESEAPNPQDDFAKAPAGAEGPGSAAADGDPLQQRLGAGAKSKKQGGKCRDGKGGKDGRPGGKALMTAAQALGSGARGKGPGKAPRGAPLPGDAPDAGGEPQEGLRSPGPQRAPVLAKGGVPSQGVAGVPVAMTPFSYSVPYPCGTAVPYPYGAVPAMYALPYYVMPQAAPLQAGTASYMPGAAPPPQPQPPNNLPNNERQNLKSQVQSQIEYYFGQDNLIKDTYLRGRLMDKNGWVEISFLAQFRRITAMTTDMSIILDAIQSSQKLELDAQGTHVRLKDTWNQWVLPEGMAPQQAQAGAAQGSQVFGRS